MLTMEKWSLIGTIARLFVRICGGKIGLIFSLISECEPKSAYERAEAITNYVERIRRTLHSYLDVSLPPELKDDLQLTDDLEDAVGPMCSLLSQHVGYCPEVRLCTRTGGRIVWHREETAEAGFRESDELVVIDEYGKVVPLKEFLTSVGVQQKNGY